MRDGAILLANRYFSGLRVAPCVAADDGFRPLTVSDAQMLLGQACDPATPYGRNRLTGAIEPVGVVAPVDQAPSSSMTMKNTAPASRRPPTTVTSNAPRR